MSETPEVHIVLIPPPDITWLLQEWKVCELALEVFRGLFAGRIRTRPLVETLRELGAIEEEPDRESPPGVLTRVEKPGHAVVLDVPGFGCTILEAELESSGFEVRRARPEDLRRETRRLARPESILVLALPVALALSSVAAELLHEAHQALTDRMDTLNGDADGSESAGWTLVSTWHPALDVTTLLDETVSRDSWGL
ncbi:hypothetical protein [Methanopyrus kandleri]|uniref:hypothetical protein n=1 Tax=Methanopyrus kandleri TaxID=2320 RepID=UPI0011E5041E|nr:hypothetical protein [Methanopyrus kandleri]